MGQLRIESLSAAYHVEAGHPEPDRLKVDLDRVLRMLPSLIARAISTLNVEVEHVCLIRRVEVDLGLDAEADPAVIGAVWASAITTAIVRRIAHDGDGVVRFDDRAAQLAHFLVQLADGHAWSEWHHDSYVGLRVLPPAMGLRTAVLDNVDLGLAALLRLDDWERGRVIDALGAAQAGLVLAGLSDGGADATDDLFPRLAEAAGCTHVSAACANRLALALYLSAAGNQRPGPETARLARAIATFHATAARGQIDIAEVTASGTVGDLVELLGWSAAEPLLPLIGLRGEDRRALGRSIEGSLGPVATRHTVFGGLFLLLANLDDMPMPDLVGCDSPEGMDPTHLLRFLVLANAAGTDQTLGVLLDPTWRDLFGVPPRLSPLLIQRWVATLPLNTLRGWRRQLDVVMPRCDIWPAHPPGLAAVLSAAVVFLFSRFARRLPGFNRSTPNYLRCNFLGVRARVDFDLTRIRVQVSRPPLDVVLAMTTIASSRLNLPWLDARTIEISREG